ncbi:MAG TPA: sigma-70 family RNA polymerase sigma factor [Fimbriiglobus sp.]|nr:sigma-70 family RNA polymerase sigma factor [Fimbriiglobus sp.]
MSEPTDFGALMDRVRAGEPGAYDELLTRYGDAVRAAVRRRLHDRLRTHYDSLDFVQDVWASFLALGPDRNRFADQDALVGFLCRVARNKVVEVFRQRFATRKNDITREEALPQSTGTATGPAGRDPTPSQVAVAGERWADLVRRLPPGHRVVLERLRDGHTHKEVAAMLNVSVRTVERIVRRLKDLCG